MENQPSLKAIANNGSMMLQSVSAISSILAGWR